MYCVLIPHFIMTESPAVAASKPPLTPLTGATRVSTGSPMPSALKTSSLSPKATAGASSPGGPAVGGSPRNVSFADSPKSNPAPGSLQPHLHPPAVGSAMSTSPFTQESVLSATDFWDDQSDGQSMSGYSAYSGRRADDPVGLPPAIRGNAGGTLIPKSSADSYRLRLHRFYQKYNPEKLSRVDEFLSAYKGDEEVLFKVLVGKYGPEPPPSPVQAMQHVAERRGTGHADPEVDVDSCDGSSVGAGASPSRHGNPVADAGGVEQLECGMAHAQASTASQNNDTRSECGSVMHYAGQRWELPKTVSPDDGRTDVATPYWPGNRAICDTDVLSLLRHLRTDNEELSRCYIGVLAQHPPSSFNGLVYVTKAPFPSSTSAETPSTDNAATSEVPLALPTPPTAPSDPFLDHQWAGRLANNKSLVHQNSTFSRTVLHCTEACQAGEVGLPTHERWRLTVYWWDGSPLALYRVMWDPIIAAQPPPADSISDTASTVSSTPSSAASSPKPTQLATATGSQAIRKASSGYAGHSRRAEQPLQPVQPPPAATRIMSNDASLTAVELMEAKVREMLVSFGRRVEERFASVERRLERLESVAFPKAGSSS